MKTPGYVVALILISVWLAGCIPGQSRVDGTLAQTIESEEGAVLSFQLFSPAFEHKTKIPARYTCSAEDTSPELQWRDVPDGVQSFALIMDDPDAPVGTWVHWILYNIPGESTGLPEGFGKNEELADGAIHGKNSGGKTYYNGPCPPSGMHRYFFKLYALDVTLDLPEGATKPEVLKAIQGHMLGMSELMGTYSR
jgi:Raf kinase inhibitor-like YbhB/YbcL family protein